MKRRTACFECETEKRLRLELSTQNSRTSNDKIYGNSYATSHNTPVENIVRAALQSTSSAYALQNYLTSKPFIKNLSQNMLVAYFISQFLGALNNQLCDTKTIYIPYISQQPKLVAVDHSIRPAQIQANPPIFDPNLNSSDPLNPTVTLTISPFLFDLHKKLVKKYTPHFKPSRSKSSNFNSYLSFYERIRRFNLYSSYFVDDAWVSHLMSRDIARTYYKKAPVHICVKNQLQNIFSPLIEAVFPFSLASPSFPNYLLLDAIALLRQSLFAFSSENGLPSKEKLFLSILLKFNYLEILNNRNALYFLILLITSCLLLSCDLSEFSDTEINSAMFLPFYKIAQPMVFQNLNNINSSEKSLIGRELRHSRLLICKALNWDINVGGIRQWLELIVTRMALRENQQLTVYWITLYYEAELIACEKNFCMQYLFDWTLTHYQAAVQCLINAILKKSNFESLLHLLNSVTAELAEI